MILRPAQQEPLADNFRVKIEKNSHFAIMVIAGAIPFSIYARSMSAL